MSKYVVDASVVVKWFFTEPHDHEALRLRNSQYQLHAPDFMLLEVDNVLCKRIRRGILSVVAGKEIQHLLRQLPLIIHQFRSFEEQAFDLANATGRSLYDCLYLALALELQAKLVTADRKFYDALQGSTYRSALCWVEDIPVGPDDSQ